MLRTYRQKKGDIGYDGNKRVKGSKISAITESHGLPVAIFIAAANIHDSKLYMPTILGLKIKLPVGRPITRPKLINADKAYDSEEIRNYNRDRGIISNIPVNKRNRRNPKIGRPFRLNKEEYAGRSVIERFFSWIEAFRKIYPRYERLEQSYLGLVMLACSLILWRV
jgi:transposase